MCHVLIIEDDWLIAEHLHAIATDAGATTVDIADTQDTAVAAALARPPTVILSDVNLAAGTGPRAVATIRHHLGHMPVIFVTGTPEDCVPCDDADAILGKPIAQAALAEALVRVVPR